MIQDPEQMRQVIALLTAIRANDRAATNAVLDDIEQAGQLRQLAGSLGAAFLILFAGTGGDVERHLRDAGLRVAQL